jgi:hypothetical protein
VQSSSHAFWRGARRGAKFGALTSLVFALFFSVFGLAVVLSRPSDRAKSFGTASRFISTMGEMCGGVGLTVIYGAIAGAFIMAIVGVVRPSLCERSEN